MRLMKKIVVEKRLVLLTGLHIGGTDVSARIGAIDSPVIRDGFGRIYIPGSSIKGKIRSLVEKSLDDERFGKYSKVFEYSKEIVRLLSRIATLKKKDDSSKDELKRLNEQLKKMKDNPPAGWKWVGNSVIHDCGKPECPVCGLFGSASSDGKMEGKVIFYDAYPEAYYGNNGSLRDDVTIETENKGENTIDRVTSEATPRFFERVPAGTTFRFTYVINVYDEEEGKRLEKRMEDYLKLLENDYLGGSGTRGYGRVRFENIEKKVIEISPTKIEEKAENN